jgi:hypothetical protein
VTAEGCTHLTAGVNEAQSTATASSVAWPSSRRAAGKLTPLEVCGICRRPWIVGGREEVERRGQRTVDGALSFCPWVPAVMRPQRVCGAGAALRRGALSALKNSVRCKAVVIVPILDSLVWLAPDSRVQRYCCPSRDPKRLPRGLAAPRSKQAAGCPRRPLLLLSPWFCSLCFLSPLPLLS